VVEEELDKETQVLAVDLVRVAVHLEDGQVVLKSIFCIFNDFGIVRTYQLLLLYCYCFLVCFLSQHFSEPELQ
jgi:hypothetical protein